ncbi:MAG: hypothetical protein PF549_00545 [Patescibacteria group bacterium]|jgi:sugar-specific transcriptional regulator TrmB|nr:hypothetical protein [Patescibacteria group bacterium]
MNEKLLKILSSLGIDEKQSLVYIACLELGSATVQELSQKSGIKRTSIYNFLEEMKQKGLLLEIEKSNKTVLVPENPEILAEKAENNLKQIKTALPELMGFFNLPSDKPKVRYYQGETGMKQVYLDLLNEKKTVYGFSDYEKMFESMKDFNPWTIPDERAQRNIEFYCIAKDGPRGKEVKARDTKDLRKTKLVENLEFETEINIYGNKVSMLSFKRPFACVIVEDQAIAQTMKSIWQNWWNLLPKE